MHQPVNSILLILLTLFPVIIHAQNRRTDSMENLLSRMPEDTAKANLIIKVAVGYLDRDDKKIAFYADELLALSNRLDYGAGKSEAYNLKGILADNRSEYATALALYDTALRFSIRYKIEKKQGNARNNIGLILAKLGDYQTALRYYIEAQKVFEKLGEKRLLANVLSNMGLVYSSLNEYNRALEYQRKALALREELSDEYGKASTYNNIALAFFDLRKKPFHIDSAIIYHQKAATIQKAIDDQYGLAISLYNLGQEYEVARMFDAAKQAYMESIGIREKIGDKHGLTYSYAGMSGVLRAVKKYSEALDYALKGLAIAKEISSDERIAKCSAELAYVYEALGDYKNASASIWQFATFLEKAYDAAAAKQAQELSIKYEVAKKDLMLRKTDAELKNRQLALEQRNMQLYMLLFLLVSGGTMSYLFYKRYRYKQETRLQAEIIRQQDIASKAVIAAEEQERKRIAGDLHDGLGQLFSAVKMNLSNISSDIRFIHPENQVVLENTMLLIDESCREIRSISHQMTPNVLLKSGLANAIRDFIDKINTNRLEVQLEVSGLTDRLDLNVETICYRVIQESVNNVIKHAQATKLDIQLHKDKDGISVTIEDNGKGFDTTDLDKYQGIGLKNIRSRVEFLKGTVEFDSAIGRGTVVTVWVPLKG